MDDKGVASREGINGEAMADPDSDSMPAGII
jgi:hypothetical protein